MSEALKPCPFCGNEAELDSRQAYAQFPPNGRQGTRVTVYCLDCGADIGICREDVPDVEPEDVIELWNRRAPTSAAGATNPNELTSSPEPAPALRAAEWVKRGLELADDFALKHALHVQGRATFAAVADAREAMEAHLSHASGLLPVAREGLSDEKIEALAIVHEAFGFGRMDERGLTTHGFDPDGLRDFARAIEAAHGIAPASGDAPGEAK